MANSICSNHEVQSKESEWWNLFLSIIIISSVIVVFIDYHFPLTTSQSLYLWIFDLFSVCMLFIDYIKRLHNSRDKGSFILKHWYEIPAMMPLIIAATPVLADSGILSYIRFIALFRLIRLYNIWTYIKGGEVVPLGALSIISVIFGALAVYLAEVEKPDANITSLYDAFWWSIETITTVSYGEFYPVTALGRLIASIMMFAAIGFVWTVVGIIGFNLVARKIKEKEQGSSTSTKITVAEETKNMIKKRIDMIEDLEPKEVEDLIRVILSLSYNPNSNNRSY
jgi:voltage-gated potassium channel